jgi:hypothetical protein
MEFPWYWQAQWREDCCHSRQAGPQEECGEGLVLQSGTIFFPTVSSQIMQIIIEILLKWEKK